MTNKQNDAVLKAMKLIEANQIEMRRDLQRLAGRVIRIEELLRVLALVAQRRSVAIGTVAIRYVLDRPQVAAAIVGATSARHLDATLQATTLRLDAEDLRAIDQVLTRATGPEGDVYALEREKGGRHARVMKYELNASERRGIIGSA